MKTQNIYETSSYAAFFTILPYFFVFLNANSLILAVHVCILKNTTQWLASDVPFKFQWIICAPVSLKFFTHVVHVLKEAAILNTYFKQKICFQYGCLKWQCCTVQYVGTRLSLFQPCGSRTPLYNDTFLSFVRQNLNYRYVHLCNLIMTQTAGGTQGCCKTSKVFVRLT